MKSGELASFDFEEYLNRIKKIKNSMSSEGIDVLLCSDPSNMNFISGYDGTSYYVHQLVLIIINYPSAIWIGRKMDVEGAKYTTFLKNEDILHYDEDYVDNPNKHPMKFVSQIIEEKGLSNSFIGVEKDCWQFTAKAAETLYKNLPNARFVNAFGLVNNVRLVKSESEIIYMKAALNYSHSVRKAGPIYKSLELKT